MSTRTGGKRGDISQPESGLFSSFSVQTVRMLRPELRVGVLRSRTLSAVRLDLQSRVTAATSISVSETERLGGIVVSSPSCPRDTIWVYVPCEQQVFFELQMQGPRLVDFLILEKNPALEAALSKRSEST